MNPRWKEWPALFFSALCTTWLLALATPCHAVFEFAGNVQSVIIGQDAVDMQIAPGALARVEFLAADVVRIRVSPYGSFTGKTSGAISPSGLVVPGAAIYDLPGAVFAVTSRMSVIITKTPFRLFILRPDNTLVSADADYPIGWDKASGLIINRKYALPNEHYFGLGLRGGPIDRQGRSFALTNIDWAGYGEFTDPLYSSTPFYYGMQAGNAYGLFLDNPATPFFDFDTNNSGILTFGAMRGELDYYVMVGPETSKVAESFARLTGFGQFPPKWALGFHQSRYGYHSQAELLSLAVTFRQLAIPCDALYLDIDYMNGLQLFSWDPLTFPDPVSMNAELENMGFKRVNIMEPALRTNDVLWPYFSGMDYLLTDAAGMPLVNNIFLGEVSWVDFTKPAARAFFGAQLKSFMSSGVSALWNDLNEPAQNYMPEAIYDYGGEKRSDSEARNLYALAETSLSYAAQHELRPNTRPWVLSRAGYPGIQRYAANWSGDTPSTFDALRVAVQMSLSMGLSGQNQFGHDVGGFMGSPSSELFIRWLQFGSLTPFFRSHAINTSTPREPWRFGEPYTSIARETINRRYRLLPYIYTLFAHSANTGAPVLAPTLYHFPSDPNSYSQNQEFMLGPQLLVAPVMTEGATTRLVYLPAPNNWYDYYTGMLYPGGQSVTVAAPLDRIPMFVKEGALIPGGPNLQHVNDMVTPRVTVDLYPGPDTELVLYEDDGASFDYTRGMFLRTRLARSEQANSSSFSASRLEGGWLPPARSWWVSFHAIQAVPRDVRLNGVSLAPVGSEAELEGATTGWFYQPGSSKLIVRVPDQSAGVEILVER